jgi:uncharacterized protein (DUF1501 family)
MAHTRRDFIKLTSLASASLMVPQFLKAFGSMNIPREYHGKTLVVIQLSGGNDGLNCVIPLHNDLYYNARPDLGLDTTQIISLNDNVGLNRSLMGLADLYNEGHLAIINSVGYPNPNRSHFRSMDIWQTASDEDKVYNTGWLGRYLDASCSGQDERFIVKPHTAVEIDDYLSLSMKGDIKKGLAFNNPANLHLAMDNQILRTVASNYHEEHEHPKIEFLHKTLADTTQSADYIFKHSKIYKSSKIYPVNDFGRRMKVIAELICSGSETKIYYVSLSGFDTHINQKDRHEKLLKVYADGLKTFCDDLKENDRFKDTVVMTFSEFGRRVAQNASRGTDHGTANNIYIAGGGLSKPGIYNDMPDLKNLDNGDLIYKIDFRQVYATILDKWLNTDHRKVLNGSFSLLDFV